MHTLCPALARLSDSDLIIEVKRLAANERHATSELVASVAVLDARRIYLVEGYSSTHAYLVGALGFSDDAAFYRITAARAVRRFPGILEMLRTGTLTLKAVRLLAPHLDEGNHRELLDAAAHKSADEIQHLLAAGTPRPDVPASIRKLPERRGTRAEAGDRPAAEGALRGLAAPGNRAGVAIVASDASRETALMNGADTRRSEDQEPAAQSMSTPAAPAPAAPDAEHALPGDFGFSGSGKQPAIAPDLAKNGRAATPAGAPPFTSPDEAARHRSVIEPLSPGRYKLQVTISAETRAKLQKAQDLLRHRVPDGDLATVLDRALTLLVEDLERRKAAIVRRPRSEAKRATGSFAPKAASRLDSSLKPVQDRTANAATPRREQARSVPMDRKPAALASGGPPGSRAAPKRRSRHIPAAVRREVWRRDEGRCRYVSPGGKQCGATSGLEFHHAVPFAAGGPSTVDNLSLRCNRHNRHEAERFFGADYAPTRTPRQQSPPAGQHVPEHVKNCQLSKSRQGPGA